MLTVTRTGNVVTVVESIMSFVDTKRMTVVYNLDTRELRVNDNPPRTMSDADVRRVTELCQRRALTGNPNIQYPLESVHVADIRAGDVVYMGGEYRTVGAKDITRNECGICIFGDSFQGGRQPVQKALTNRAIRVESPAVEEGE